MKDGLPALARFVLSRAAPPQIAEFVVGDFAEEYRHRHSESGGNARRWLWKQVLASTPRLFIGRLTPSSLKTLAALGVATAASLAVLLLWDIYVARQLTRSVASAAPGLPMLSLSALYVCLHAVAFAGAGAVIARTCFRREASLVRNALLKLSPLVAAQFIPPFFSSAFGDSDYPFLFLVPWAAVCTIALVAGAMMAAKRARGNH